MDASPARIDVARRHAHAESEGDLATTLATLEGEPVFELYPIGLQLRGMDNVRVYYEHFFAHVRPRMLGYALRAEWVGELGLLQEYDVTCRVEGGNARAFRVVGILKSGDRLLSGERLYASEEFLRILFGPLWARMEPL